MKASRLRRQAVPTSLRLFYSPFRGALRTARQVVSLPKAQLIKLIMILTVAYLLVNNNVHVAQLDLQ